MRILNLSAAVMAAGLLIAAPAFSQSQSNTAQKQPTQEGGSSLEPLPCGLPFNASPSSDPNCNTYKQRTQNLTHADPKEFSGQTK